MWFLVIWLFIDGRWVQGDDTEGWAAMEQPSYEVCLEKKKRAYNAGLVSIGLRAPK